MGSKAESFRLGWQKGLEVDDTGYHTIMGVFLIPPTELYT